MYASSRNSFIETAGRFHAGRPGRFFLVLFLAGCATPRSPELFVLRDSLPESKFASTGKTLLVADFNASSEYLGQAFAYRTSPNRIAFDPFRRWAVSPADMVRERVIAYLRGSGLYDRVAQQVLHRPPAFILNGTILRLGERVEAGKRIAELSLHLELLDAGTEKIIWQATKSRDQEVANESFDDVISALSDGMSAILKESCKEMGTALPKQ